MRSYVGKIFCDKKNVFQYIVFFIIIIIIERYEFNIK